MSNNLINPNPLSGFQDLLPSEALKLETIKNNVSIVFNKYGYKPIDTPCIYRYETLFGSKAEVDKQIFDWSKSGGDHVGLRFDLTVPFARYIAANYSKLTFPFKRYEIGKVWRGENPQKGRYREFYQCDYDIVGTNSSAADLEILLTTYDSLVAIKQCNFTIYINMRSLLDSLLNEFGLGSYASVVLRAIDKFGKISEEKLLEDLIWKGIPKAEAQEIIDFILISKEGDNKDILYKLRQKFPGHEGIGRLEYLIENFSKLRDLSRIRIDLSIARGLNYYTGMVFETFLNDDSNIGSIASGGRYDNLTSVYMKDKLSGVGGSIGLSRLMSIVPLNNIDKSNMILVVTEPSVYFGESLVIANRLRENIANVELYFQDEKSSIKLAKQLKYADQNNFMYVVIVAPDELYNSKVVVKTMSTGVQEEVNIYELNKYFDRLLN